VKVIHITLLVFLALVSSGQSSPVFDCSYAPSQSKAVAAISGAAGGASATIGAVASATGMTVVSHSSGAMILTGSSGYIAGTIGTAAAVPVIVGVSLLVGGTAVVVEVVCANKNHPEQVAKVYEAATEFSIRFKDAMRNTKVAVGEMEKKISPATDKAVVKIKQIAEDVWKYAYKKK